METWDIWYPKAAATGLAFARCAIDSFERVLVHAAPDVLTVEVRDADGRRLAFGKELQRTLDSPICLLARNGGRIERRDLWPGEPEIGLIVLLPGGEAGVLRSWWNADDHNEWRWQVEFYNSRR
jgi:hypothetical protein